MKKLLFKLTIFFNIVITPLFAQDNAIFVYRNDGDFNAFLLSDVIEMTQSKEDTLGVLHDEYCVQEILTSDSLYRIPISVIDSIGFHPLPIEYQPEVVFANTLNGLEQWIIQTSDSTILVSENTPIDCLPENGQILYEPSNTLCFPEGYCGRLIKKTNESNGILLFFEKPQITEVFKTLQFVGHGSTQNENVNRASTRSANDDYSNSEITHLNLPQEISLSLGPVSLTAKPDMQLYSYVLIQEGQLLIKNRLKGHFDCEVSLTISSPDDSPLKFEPEPAWLPALKVPLGPTGFFFRTSLGVFLQAELTGEISTGLPFTVDGDITMTRVNNNLPQIHCNVTPHSDFNYNLSVNANGWVADGLAVQAGLEWVGNYAAIVFEAGPKIKASLNIHSDGYIDNSLYSAIKDTKIEGSIMADTYLSIHRAYIKEGHNFNSPHIKYEQSLASIYVVPEFSNLQWIESETDGGGQLDGNILREVPLGVQLGWALYDQQDLLYSLEMYNPTYRYPNEWPIDGLNKLLTMATITSGTRYTAYPVVSLFGIRMRADKKVDVITTPDVRTEDARNNGPQSTSLYGFCYFDAGSYPGLPNVGFEYSEDGINWDRVPSSDLSVDGSFSVTLQNLNCLTSYRYRAYAERDGVRRYGYIQYFSTLPPNMDGTWQCEEGDGTSYTVTIQGTQCTWSGEMAEPGSLTWHSRGNLEISILMSWRPESMGGYSTINFAGSVDDKNHPNIITGEVEYHSGAMNTGYDYLLKNTSFTMTRGN